MLSACVCGTLRFERFRCWVGRLGNRANSLRELVASFFCTASWSFEVTAPEPSDQTSRLRAPISSAFLQGPLTRCYRTLMRPEQRDSLALIRKRVDKYFCELSGLSLAFPAESKWTVARPINQRSSQGQRARR